MNDGFAQLYADPEFVDLVTGELAPVMLELGAVSDDPLHLAAGPAQAAQIIRDAAARLTIAQLDPGYTAQVADRFADDDSVDVVGADPTALPFDRDRFSAVTLMLTLEHAGSAARQDQLLREARRVLRPGGLLLGVHALDGPHFRRFNDGGDAVAIDPMTLTTRLEAAGFRDVHLDVWQFPRFSALAVDA